MHAFLRRLIDSAVCCQHAAVCGDMTVSNALSPDRMSAAERLDEIGDLLAAALMRLRARKSSPISADGGESSLAMSPDQRMHAATENRMERDDG
jgi:hypothetical protein